MITFGLGNIIIEENMFGVECTQACQRVEMIKLALAADIG